MLNEDCKEGSCMKVYELPKVSKKKIIDVKKLEPLAKKIKKYFEEEERLINKKRNENSSSGRILLGY